MAPTWGESIAKLNTIATDIHNTLKAILSQLGGEPGEPPEPTESIISNYPRTNMKDLPIGITDINTRLGKAILPDGSVELFSAPIPNEPCHSILLYTNARIDMLLMDGDKTNLSSTIFPSWIRIHKVQFDRIKITTTAISTVYLSISNVEAPSIEASAEHSNKTSWVHGQQNVAVPLTAVQMPSITIPDGFFLLIKAKPANLGNIYVGNSAPNAINHTVSLTLQSNEVVRLRIENADLVFLDADNGGEGVEYTVESE